MTELGSQPIYKYLRNKKRHKIGVLLSTKILDTVYIAWALCRKTEPFSVDRGIEIALNRAINVSKVKVPNSIRDEYIDFIDRSRRYFKDVKCFLISGLE